jgi:sugar lactone lactonase YvrE
VSNPSDPVSVWELKAELGEGPIWVERDQALWFTDIKKRKIHRLDPATDERTSWDAPELVGFVLPAAGEGFVAGLQSGLHHFDSRTGGFRPIAEVEPDLPANRLNDATVDPSGRLWFGTMDNEEKAPAGAIYRLADNGRIEHAGGECCITNGPAVSPDGRTLYHVDTLGKVIYAADIDEEGRLGDRRLFCTIGEEDGHPDGPSVDAEGCLWIGLYGGWAARRYSPAGELLQTVRFPVANVTKIALGGADRRTAFATTARQGLTGEALAAQPGAGNLFAFRVSAPGVPGIEVSRGLRG